MIWREEELEPDCNQARRVMGEWTRAEPDHRMMTEEEVQAWLADMRRASAESLAADEARWARDKERYDADREQARWALLEREAMRARLTPYLEAHRSGTKFPGMQPNLRAKAVAKLEFDHEQNDNEIEKLVRVVGDPEQVVDADGRLPGDRRPLHRVGYSVHRRFKVEELRAAIVVQREKVTATVGRKAKSALEPSLRTRELELTALLAVPRLAPEDMCSECETPLYEHLSGDDDEHTACPRWPMRKARMERAFDNLRFVLDRMQPPEPEPPKPQPVATLPGNLPIADVITRLSELQQEHPAAIVKKGRANQWELWPGEE